MSNTLPWYRQAAQDVLDKAGVPDLYGPLHHGRTAASLMYSGTPGSLIALVGTNHGGRLIDSRPAPRKTHDLTLWEAARAYATDCGFGPHITVTTATT